MTNTVSIRGRVLPSPHSIFGAFMFLAFAMPFLAGFNVAEVVQMDLFFALMLLWSIALGNAASDQS